MTDISQTSMVIQGTKKQAATSHDGHPGGGRSFEARKMGLQRRRAKGLDDVPNHPDAPSPRQGRSKKKTTKKKIP
jgi:hypothetical protein